MALGAQASDVLKLVLGQGMRLILIGAALGVLASVGLTHFLSSLLFNVSPLDVQTHIAVVALMIVIGLLACLLPARRAVMIDPAVALRDE